MPQLESTLLLTPAEIRHGIYLYLLPDRIHVRLRGDKFCLSACLEPGRGGDEDGSKPFTYVSANTLDGHERKFSRNGFSDPVWARRLRSTWGPHWKCEENVLDKYFESKFNATLLLVCKRMFFEVVDLLARTAVVHITDLETVNYLNERTVMPSTPLSIFPSLLLEVTQLSITLRLPLRFYQSLERPEDAVTSGPELAGAIKTWLRLGSTFSQLKNLTRLRLWLDHDEPCSCKETGQNHLEVIHKPDFPFLLDIIDFAETPMAEVEEEERAWWRDGIDVEREVEEMNKPRWEHFTF
ncbi:hypothetical protein K469DRAFT_753425 [Zopfia rhizophila CBS 207.26]|uniref:DUF7730 domain-containing protein n=1 Tax=Zopfia rhizophila CBS 207.26 TaxID=1314779 RepID=A0A6A6DQ14_9PEZI|nr:hypothetical protein K469DRAFT_753425 [Zopfia rhizophila CBS 207.26]